MAFVLPSGVHETTSTTGTGDVTLGGAVTNRRSFGNALSDGDTFFYGLYDGTDFEWGVGTYTSSTDSVSRDTIIESTNGDAAVNWSAGTRDIIIGLPGDYLANLLDPTQTGLAQRTSATAWSYLSVPLAVNKGGTGSTTAAGAMQNLLAPLAGDAVAGFKPVTSSQTWASGSTLTFSNFLVANAAWFWVVIKVETGITGPTSFDVGSSRSGFEQAWGVAVSPALNTVTKVGNGLIQPWSYVTGASAEDLVLTANGGAVSGGLVRATGLYMTFTG